MRKTKLGRWIYWIPLVPIFYPDKIFDEMRDQELYYQAMAYGAIAAVDAFFLIWGGTHYNQVAEFIGRMIR